MHAYICQAKAHRSCLLQLPYSLSLYVLQGLVWTSALPVLWCLWSCLKRWPWCDKPKTEHTGTDRSCLSMCTSWWPKAHPMSAGMLPLPMADCTQAQDSCVTFAAVTLAHTISWRLNLFNSQTVSWMRSASREEAEHSC